MEKKVFPLLRIDIIAVRFLMLILGAIIIYVATLATRTLSLPILVYAVWAAALLTICFAISTMLAVTRHLKKNQEEIYQKEIGCNASHYEE